MSISLCLCFCFGLASAFVSVFVLALACAFVSRFRLCFCLQLPRPRGGIVGILGPENAHIQHRHMWLSFILGPRIPDMLLRHTIVIASNSLLASQKPQCSLYPLSLLPWYEKRQRPTTSSSRHWTSTHHHQKNVKCYPCLNVLIAQLCLSRLCSYNQPQYALLRHFTHTPAYSIIIRSAKIEKKSWVANKYLKKKHVCVKFCL